MRHACDETGEAMTSGEITQLIQIVGRLPEGKVSEVLDFAQFLLWQESKQEGEVTPFEVWAEKLAQTKGFAYLKEEDVARIVHESRKAAK